MSSRDKKLLENLNAYEDPDNQESQQQQQQQNDDELSIFANTHFYDVDMGRPTDIAVTVDELLMQQEKQLQYPRKQPSVHPALLDHDEAQFDSQHQEHYAHLPHHYQQQQQHQHQQRQLGAGSSHDSYLETEHEIQVPPHVPSNSALFEFNEFQEFSLATELPIFDYHSGVGISPVPQARQLHAAQAVIATPPPHQYSQQILDDPRSIQHPVQHPVQYPVQQHQHQQQHQHHQQPPQPQQQVRAPASYQPEPVQNFRQPPSIPATSGPSISRHSSSVSISSSVQPPAQAPTPALSTSSSDDRNGERFVSEDEKRRRNTEASARFRFKKKLREQEMERNKRQMQTRINELETQVRQLQLENKLLKKLVNNASEQREAAELESLRNKAKEPKKKPSPKGDDDEDKESDTKDS